MTVAVIVNPISGTGGRPAVARARIDAARRLLAVHGVDGGVFMTERPGHARELARTALADGARTLIAWGGDGTVNEVGSVLAFTDVPLGIIPSGSGNGLARELRVPRTPADAFALALGPSERLVDCGEIDGHLFFNVAGIGLDARVAHQFALRGLVRRGFRRYLEIAVRELFRGESDEHTIVANGLVHRQRLLLLVVANGTQYGNGATIAPDALLDDGLLDVVAIAARPALVALVEAPLLLLGGRHLPGVMRTRASDVTITSADAVLFHVDGEPQTGGTSVIARVHPGALRVKAAANAG